MMIFNFLLLLAGVSTCSNLPVSPQRLSSVLNTNADLSNSKECEKLYMSLPEGTYIGDSIDISHRWMELTGEPSNENEDSKTSLIASPKTEMNSKTVDEGIKHSRIWMFSLTNSTLSLKWMDISLLDTSAEERSQNNEARTTRLAIVSNSMLTISESGIELSPWSSAILIAPSTLEESATESSVVIKNSCFSNDVGEMRGVVETSAFPSLGGSVSVSIVGCSFNSQAILGKDGIGLSLTRTARKSAGEVGRISSSLIGCSFVNMSSIGSSRQPHLPHLSQKMLGCVVSLTSSHLSGSTIRDMNTGGSVLCSNCSFSSLLSSPNIDTDTNEEPSIILDDATTLEYVDGREYSFDSTNLSTSACFSHCHFKGDDYSSYRPLAFNNYPGTISILSCFFDYIERPEQEGGAVFVSVVTRFDRPCFTAKLSNFSRCSALSNGGGMSINVKDNVLIESCRFERCSAWYSAGGLDLHGPSSTEHIPLINIVDCVFSLCWPKSEGGGIRIGGCLDVSVVDSMFDNCAVFEDAEGSNGGGIFASGTSALSVERCNFIKCSSIHAGGAIYFDGQQDLVISDTLVKGCSSSATGAVFIQHLKDGELVSFSRVYFDGNTVGTDNNFFTQDMGFPATTTRFPDVAIICNTPTALPFPTLKFEDCFTTVSSDSTGMIVRGNKLASNLYEPKRHLDTEFENIGPLLTASPKAKVNGETGKIELEIEGTIPPISQEYEVTGEGLSATFTGQSGTLVGRVYSATGNAVPLKFGQTYEILSITRTNNQPILFVPLSFSVPTEPARIESTSSVLNGPKTEVTVTLTGRELFSATMTVKVKNSNSNRVFTSSLKFVDTTSCTVIFPAGQTETDSELVFGGSYDVVSVESSDGKKSFVVNTGVKVSVPSAAIINSITSKLSPNCTHFEISFSGSYLPSVGSFVASISPSITLALTFVDGVWTTGWLADGEQGMKMNTSYSVMKIADDVNEMILNKKTFTAAEGPTLSSIPTVNLKTGDLNSVVLSLDGLRMPVSTVVPSFDLIIIETGKTTEITIAVSFSTNAIGSGEAVVYKSGKLKYSTSYSVVRMTSTVVSASIPSTVTFTTPPAPTRIISAACDLDSETGKSAEIVLKGVSFPQSKSFTLSVFELNVASEKIGNAIELSSSFAADGSPTSHTLSSLIYKNDVAKLKYQTSYEITKFVIPGIDTIVDSLARFSVPSEPARLIKTDLVADPGMNVSTLTLTSRQLITSQTYTVALSGTPIEQTNSDSVHTLGFEVEGAPSITKVMNLYPDATLRFNHLYKVTSMTLKSSSTPIFIESDECTFSTPPEPLRIEDGDGRLNSPRTEAVVTLTGLALKAGSYSFTLTHSNTANSRTITGSLNSDGIIECSHTVEESNSNRLIFGETYTITSATLNTQPILFHSDITREKSGMII